MKTRPRIYIPPGGYLTQASLSQASQLIARPSGAAPRRRKRKATRGAKRATRRARTTRSTKRTRVAARMVKGSAAARRHMAKLRRMRRK